MNLGNDVDITKNMFPVMSLYDDMLSQLKCPNCNAYWKREPIEMCEQGHNICHGCQAHISPNANCTAQPSNVRNIALENIVATAIYLCPFAISDGARCAWSGVPFDMADHVRHSHDSERVAGTEESEWIPLSLSFEWPLQTAIFALDKLFFPLSSIREGRLFFAVFHVGHKDDSSRYRYDFRMEISDDPQQSHSENSVICHNYMENRNEVEVSGDCIILYRDSIRKYVTDSNDVSCDIKIKRTDTSEDVEMMETTENTTQPAVSSEGAPEDTYCA